MMEFKNTSKKSKAVRVTGGLEIIRAGETRSIDPSRITGDAAYLDGLKAAGLQISETDKPARKSQSKRVKKTVSKAVKTDAT